MKNPFIYGKIASGESFTDREAEQKQLSANIVNGINSIIISPRRWGKSSLVSQVASNLKDKSSELIFCFIDLFNVRSEQEFYSYLAKEVLRVSFSKWKERIESARNFFKQITPKFSIGTDLVHGFSLSFDWEEVKKAPEEILNLPELVSKKRNKRIIV